MDENTVHFDHAHIDSLDVNDLCVEKLCYLTSLKKDIPRGESAQSIVDESHLEKQESNTENNSLNSKYLYFYVNVPAHEPFYQKLILYRNATYDYVATLTYLMKMHYKKVNRKSPHSVLLTTCKQLLNEYFLWDLFYVLELFHFNTENGDVTKELARAELTKHQSEYDYVSYLFVKYPDMELAQIIIDWCERCYFVEKKFSLVWSNDFDSYPGQIDFLEEMAAEFKSKPRKRSHKHKYEPYRIDPDSVDIYKRNIPNDVQETIESTNKKLYQCIRSGKLTKAIDLCLSQKQFWKAAVMQGWQLEKIENNARVEGNHMRLKWRQMCDRISNNKQYDIYERAFYGAFSNNIDVQLEVKESYRDLIWAYCKYYLDKKISSPSLDITLHQVLIQHIDVIFDESSAKNACIGGKQFADPVDDCYRSIVRVILESLAPTDTQNAAVTAVSTHQHATYHPNDVIDAKSSLPEKLRLAILDTFNCYCGNLAANTSINKIHFLRFLSYLYLLIKPSSIYDSQFAVELAEVDEECVDFVSMCEWYFDALVANDETDLVPFLLTFLPHKFRYASFSRLLQKISPIANKTDIISLSKSTNLDIVDMVSSHYDDSIRYLLETHPMDLDKMISELNECIEWFLHDPKLSFLVIVHCERVMNHVISYLGIFQTNFNEFIVSKVAHLRNCQINLALVNENYLNMSMESYEEIVEQFQMEFDVLYSVTAFDKWIHGEKFCDENYVKDLLDILENTFYNDKFYSVSDLNLKTSTLILDDSTVYGYLVKLWHPYCVLYMAKLYLSRKMYSQVLELSYKSTSVQHNKVIDYFTKEQCTIFMDTLSEAARHLLEQDKIPISSNETS